MNVIIYKTHSALDKWIEILVTTQKNQEHKCYFYILSLDAKKLLAPHSTSIFFFKKSTYMLPGCIKELETLLRFSYQNPFITYFLCQFKSINNPSNIFPVSKFSLFPILQLSYDWKLENLGIGRDISNGQIQTAFEIST